MSRKTKGQKRMTAFINKMSDVALKAFQQSIEIECGNRMLENKIDLSFEAMTDEQLISLFGGMYLELQKRGYNSDMEVE